jgi:putative hydrolase
MAFWGDYHTHTIYSHGHGTIEENVERAVEIGLKEVAITDHGFRHMMYNVRHMDWKYMHADTQKVRAKYPQIQIYLGLETNLSSRFGKADILPSDMDNLDLVICGYHKFVMPDRPSDMAKFFLPNFLFGGSETKSSAKLIKRNTDAYLKALEKYDIDIVSHINHAIKADAVEVARACKHYGTYVELNGKRVSMKDCDIEKMAQEGVQFICNSDAHSAGRVGDFSVPMAVVERLGIPFDQIANWEKLPKFRSRKKKGLYKE